MTDFVSQIADNVAAVRERIAQAARASGRAPEAVTLIAVTKYVGMPEIAALVAAGCHDLGESRPQTLWDKVPAVGRDDVRWHVIGHLQRNKVRRTLPLVSLVHSVDSERLLRAIDEESAALRRVTRVLLEVNVSGDEAKHGFAPAELPPLLPHLNQYQHVQVAGLMAMAARTGGEDVAERNFEQLRTLRERLLAQCPPEVALDELSMGMSGDFEAAIRQGATLVRVGSALFEGLDT